MKDGRIKCNCPACLEPEVLVVKTILGVVSIRCGCGFAVLVPWGGPNPQIDVALEIIGANELGEKQEGDRRLIVHEGEAMDVIINSEAE